MKAQNILKVVDILKNEVHPDTVKFLNHNFIVYRDSVLKEHLYNASEAVEVLDDPEYFEDVEEDIAAIIKTQILAICALLNENDAGYVRLISH